MRRPGVIFLIIGGVAAASQPQLDPGLPGYSKVEGIRGTLNAAGSDTAKTKNPVARGTLVRKETSC